MCNIYPTLCPEFISPALGETRSCHETWYEIAFLFRCIFLRDFSFFDIEIIEK